MPPVMPLSCWQLSGRALPARLIPAPRQASFSLPGAQALAGFAGLLGEDGCPSPQKEERPSAPFALPGLLPEDMPGEAILRRELRLGRLGGEYAALHIDLLLGRGDVYLDEERVASFSGGPFSLDLTKALLSGRSHTLTFRFDGTRPAGMLGGVLLRTACRARILRTALLPHASSQTMTLRVFAHGLREGTYLLRAQPLAPASDGQEPLAREMTLTLARGETRAVEMTLSIPGGRFVPGEPYDAPRVRLSLWQARPRLRPREQRRGFWLRKSDSPSTSPRLRPGALCDTLTLMCGYPGDAPQSFLPLRPRECLLPPQELAGRVRKLRVPAVFLPVPAPDILARELTRAGIAALQKTPRDERSRERLAHYPCITLTGAPVREQGVSLEASAFCLSSIVGMPRRLDPRLAPADLLSEIAGRELDPASEETRAVLLWLRALCVRLRAEAARQGRFRGALCAPGEWDDPDIASALETAFAPLHLSALPQRGAWWTLSRFSASLRAFLPPEGLSGDLSGGLSEGLSEGLSGSRSAPRASGDALLAEAVLEDEEGGILARLCAPCPRAGGEIGVLEAALPASPCVLTLSTRLLLGETVLEQSAIPVYVGERGALESAFGRPAPMQKSTPCAPGEKLYVNR